LPFAVELNPPMINKPLDGWMPALGIKSPSKKSGQYVAFLGKNEFSKQTILLDCDNLKKIGSVANNSRGLAELAFEASPGLKKTTPKGEQILYGRERETYNLYSLADFNSESVDIYLNKWTHSEVEPNGWFYQHGELSKAEANFVVGIKSSRQLPKFASLLKGSKVFSIAKGDSKAFSGPGLYVMKGADIVGSVRVGKLNKEQMADIVELLGGDFIFKGESDAFRKLPTSLVQRRAALISMLEEDEKVQVVLNGKIIEISSIILTTKRDLLDAIARDAIGTMPSGTKAFRP
jgi:hypothetical protein